MQLIISAYSGVTPTGEFPTRRGLPVARRHYNYVCPVHYGASPKQWLGSLQPGYYKHEHSFTQFLMDHKHMLGLFNSLAEGIGGEFSILAGNNPLGYFGGDVCERLWRQFDRNSQRVAHGLEPRTFGRYKLLQSAFTTGAQEGYVRIR